MYSDTLKISSDNKKCLMVASLSYYLGTMPYQSAFKDFMVENLGMKDYNHEEVSFNVLKSALHEVSEKSDLLQINDEDLDKIECIILGKSYSDDTQFLSQILNNKAFNVDIIKINDIERDCKYYGTNEGFDYNIPASTARVINGSLVYNHKVSYSLFYNLECIPTLRALQMLLSFRKVFLQS